MFQNIMIKRCIRFEQCLSFYKKLQCSQLLSQIKKQAYMAYKLRLNIKAEVY